MCTFQLSRSYKRQEENNSKIGQERSSMQQADYQFQQPTPWMQESVSMHKSPTPLRHSNWIKQGRRKRKKRDRKDWGQEADGKQGSQKKKKKKKKKN